MENMLGRWATRGGLIFCILLNFNANSVEAKTKPWIHGMLGIVPGLGHVTQGRVAEGFAWAGATVVAYSVALPWSHFIMYNMYDSFQAAGGKPTGKSNVFENYIAVYNPLNAIDPIGGPLLAGYGYSVSPLPNQRSALSNIFHYSFIGWSEEALFRGFLYPAISDLFHSRVVGAILSSLIFGMVHYNYTYAQQAFVATAGLIWSIQLTLNEYDLRKNIFSHSWVDILAGLKGGGFVGEAGAPSANQQNDPTLMLRIRFAF